MRFVWVTVYIACLESGRAYDAVFAEDQIADSSIESSPHFVSSRSSPSSTSDGFSSTGGRITEEIGDRAMQVEASLENIKFTSIEDIDNLSPQLKSGWSDIIDNLPNVWDQGQSVIDNLNCAQLPSTTDCCKNKCPICVAGKLLKILNSAGKFSDVFTTAKVNQAQIDAGEICGMPEAQCKYISQYFDNLPSLVRTMLSWVMIVPHYYKAGECPNGALASMAMSSGLVGVATLAYFI